MEHALQDSTALHDCTGLARPVQLRMHLCWWRCTPYAHARAERRSEAGEALGADYA